jgi:transposase
MYSIQQEEFFSIEDLMNLQLEAKGVAVLEHLPVQKILRAVNKRTVRGRPEELNTRAMLYSLILGKMERISSVKFIIKRLHEDDHFRKCCRFTASESIPSASSYSRLITKLHRCGVLNEVMEQLVEQAIAEGMISGETLAIDSSHLEAWDCHPKLKEKQKPRKPAKPKRSLSLREIPETPVAQPEKPEKPKRNKRGGIPKAEKAAWNARVAAYYASLTIFEKKVADMLDCSYTELLDEMPQYPSTGGKGDPRRNGRMMYWYGFKANLVVDAQSQFIVCGLFSSGHVSDQRLAIVLLKGLRQRFPNLCVKYVLADKGYDSTPVYQQVRRNGAYALIPLIQHAKEPLTDRDEEARPLCKKGHAYRYDSFNEKTQTLKYTRPKECTLCEFRESGCQKIHKIRIEKDLRLYTAPARGSVKFKKRFKQRTAIERVFAYLKLNYNMGKSRLLSTRSRVDFELSCLTYNLCKYAAQKTNQEISKSKQTA